MRGKEIEEIAIFGHHDGAGFPRPAEDLSISGVSQPEVSNRNRLDVRKLARDPGGQIRGAFRPPYTATASSG